MLRRSSVVKSCIVGCWPLSLSVVAAENPLFKLLASGTGLEKMFLFLAVPATVLFIIMAILTFVGVGADDGDLDLDTDTDSDAFSDSFHVFTIRNFIVFFMMFGWSGMAMSRSGASNTLSVAIAALIGVVMIFIVSYLFFIVAKLAHSGNISTQSTLGSTGTVYLSIPEKRTGSGKVTVVVNGSKVELKAMTDGEMIATGECVTIKEIAGSDIVIVEKPETKEG